MNPSIRDNAFYSGIAALLMLVFGWVYALSGTSESAFYNASVTLFTWMLRLGGLSLLAVAVLCYLERPLGLLLDAAVSGICGAIMLGCSLTWLIWESTHGYALSINGFLFIIFGVMYVRSAAVNWSGWKALSSTVSAAAPRPAVGPAASPAPVPHPASIRPRSMSGESPPPGGYLAALSKEDEEPPSASYE